jgi:hypothetical protein
MESIDELHRQATGALYSRLWTASSEAIRLLSLLTIMRTLHAGVLILGSLLWDNANRENWRRQRLHMRAAERVWLPIRYGRESRKTRRNTHTMVFSTLCYRQRQLGVGYAVPCSRDIKGVDDLIEQAGSLAEAEGLKDLAWTWGAVGILENPSIALPQEITDAWRQHFRRASRDCELFRTHAPSERAVVSEDGFLRLRWPTRVDGNGPVKLDLLLATPTAPTLTGGRYPSPREIGSKYANQDYPTYFIGNITRQIRTAQDLPIWKAMILSRPDWEAHYERIGRTVSAGAR